MQGRYSMNLWQGFERKQNKEKISKEILLHFQNGIDKELKKLFISFTRWLRINYIFPINIHVYIINAEKIRLLNGNLAYGGFRWFAKRTPMIRIASAIEKELLTKYKKEEIHEQILSSFVHELTHYYQWVLKLEQSNDSSERQANYFRYKIIDKYFDETNQNKK